MQTIIQHIRYDSKSAVFRIVPLADLHLGNVACDEKALQQTVDGIAADESAYWIGMGDYAEFIKPRDMRFDQKALAPWLYGKADVARHQIARLKKLLTPIAPQCLGLLTGNHERDIQRRWDHDVYTSIVEALAPDGAQKKIRLGFSGFILLRFHRLGDRKRTWTLPLFVTHGWWGGRLYGNGGLNLERVFGWVQAQMVLAGHDHKKRALSISRVKPRANGGIERIDGWCCSCGSFLDMPRYAEERGYRPLPIGPLEILVRPYAHEVRVVQ